MKKLILLLLSVNYGMVAQVLPPLTWNIYTVKDPQQSAGFIDVADFNNDGKKEIVLRTLMEQGNAGSPWSAKGAIRIFSMPVQGISGTWSEQVILPTSENLPFCNHPQVMDVNGDGNKDVLLQQGFLQTNGGSHQWLQGPNFSTRNDFDLSTSFGNTWYFWHESDQCDLDGDGLLDIVTTSAQTQDPSNNNNGSINPKKAKVEWYKNLGNGQFQYTEINDSLGGVFIKTHDIDNDGDKDIVLSQFFWGTSRPALVWLENVAAPSALNNWKGNWNYHVIDHTTGLGYYFSFADINADGNEDLVYCNHNNEDNNSITDGNGNLILPGIFWFDIPANPAASSQWNKHTIYDGFRTNLYDFGNPASQGTPGLFSVGDVDLNGLPDLVVPGDGNDTLYLFRQYSQGNFQKEVVDLGKMFGHAMITDLDGDGMNEIVAAKHNFPELWQILFPPAGYLKIYLPFNIGLGINETKKDEVKIYPNPASDKLFVCADGKEEEMTFEIFNISGQKILDGEIDQKGEINFDDNIVKGIYLLKITGNDFISIRRFEISR